MDGTVGNIDLASFFETERSRLSGFIRKKLYRSSGMETEDIVQDIMLRVINAAVDNPIGNLGAYVYRTARNYITDYFRKKSRDAGIISVSNENEDWFENLTDGKSDIEEILENREARKALFNALDSLKADRRMVWEATELEGYTMAELSELWSVPVGTLLSRKSRANDNLKSFLSNKT